MSLHAYRCPNLFFIINKALQAKKKANGSFDSSYFIPTH